MTGVFVACLIALVVSSSLAIWRVARGPSMLDRAVSADIVTSCLLGFVAVYSAMTGRRDLVTVLVALALVGFIATVTVARFVGADSDEERRILTPEELAEMVRTQAALDDDAAPVHDVDAGGGDDAGTDAAGRVTEEGER